MTQNLLTFDGYAQALQCSRATLERWIRDDNFDGPRPFRLGRRRFVHGDDVSRFIDRRRGHSVN